MGWVDRIVRTRGEACGWQEPRRAPTACPACASERLVALAERAPSYKAVYRGPDGHSRSKTFKRKREADAYLASVEHAKNVGTYLDPRLGAITLAEFWSHYWKTSRPPAESTQAHYAMQLAPRRRFPCRGCQGPDA